MDQAINLGVAGWHRRFLQQASWTSAARRYVCERIGIKAGDRLLEVGCGTGAITIDLAENTQGKVHGIDINISFLKKAALSVGNAQFINADFYSLPYPDHQFDACVCHFLFLWLKHPLDALREMIRITRTGGYIVLFAEPDYSARIDYPLELEEPGKQQADSLTAQGANPYIGRSIAHLLWQAGCREIHSGLTGGEWTAMKDDDLLQSEHKILRNDLSGQVSEEQMENLLHLDMQAWQNGYRILFVPTFYTWGVVG